MQKYNIPIVTRKRRVKIFRDHDQIREEIEKYQASKYLRSLLLKKDSRTDEQIKKDDEEKREQEKLEEQDRLEDEARKQRLEDLKTKKKSETRYYQEFVVSNENKLVQIDLKKVLEDSIPLSIAKEQIQRAYEDGMDDGQISAMSTYKTEIVKYQEWVRRFDATANELGEKQVASINKMEESVIELAVLISEHILQEKIDQDENLVIKQVRKAIESVRTESVFKIHVHPEAKEILKEVKSTLIEEYQLNDDIVIHPNPTVPIGSCLLETSAGLIDGRIKNQLRQIENNLVEEANRSIQTEEMQQEINEFDNQHKKKKELEDLEPINVESDDFSYDDMPDEYKEMFAEDIFGNSDMDADGNIISDNNEQDQTDQLDQNIDSSESNKLKSSDETDKIDYSNIDQEIDPFFADDIESHPETEESTPKKPTLAQRNPPVNFDDEEELSDDDIYLSDHDEEDIDRNFDDLFNND